MLDNQRSAQTAGARVLNENQLIEEIIWFETRLSEIGGGECAGLEVGEFATVRVTDAGEHDLWAVTV